MNLQNQLWADLGYTAEPLYSLKGLLKLINLPVHSSPFETSWTWPLTLHIKPYGHAIITFPAAVNKTNQQQKDGRVAWQGGTGWRETTRSLPRSEASGVWGRELMHSAPRGPRVSIPQHAEQDHRPRHNVFSLPELCLVLLARSQNTGRRRRKREWTHRPSSCLFCPQNTAGVVCAARPSACVCLFVCLLVCAGVCTCVCLSERERKKRDCV